MRAIVRVVVGSALVAWAGSVLAEPAGSTSTYCVQQDGQTIGSLSLSRRPGAAVDIEREHWVLYVQGARAEGDLQIHTEIRRNDQGLLAASRRFHAGEVTEQSDARWQHGQWQLRFQTGATVERSTQPRPIEHQPDVLGDTDIDVQRFDALNFELLSFRRQQNRWADAEGLRVFHEGVLGLEPVAVALMGLRLTLLPCAEQEARRRRHSLDLDQVSGLALPDALTDASRDGKLGFEFRQVPEGLTLPELSTQTARRQGERLAVVVCARCQLQAGPESPPPAAATRSNAYIDSDHPAVQAQAQALRADSERETMRKLVRFVRRHLWQQTDTLGYASASQALLSAQGNCSEHALLLAALARANGIPTRVLHGLAYHPDRRHQRAALLPHMWVQAWVDGRWQHFDAGQKGYSATHIALAMSDGDPRPINDTLALILSAKVQRVVALN